MITVENNHSKKHFCVLYKAPSMNQETFLLNLDSLPHDVSQIKEKIWCCGDLNVDNLVNSSFLVDYKNLLLSIGLKLLNEEPTRKTTHSSSCIDHVFANIYHEVSTLKCTIRDHYALLFNTDLERHFDMNTSRKYRDFRCLLEETTACKLLFLLNHRLSKASSLELIPRILVDTCNIYCPEKNCHPEQKIAVLRNSRFEKTI